MLILIETQMEGIRRLSICSTKDITLEELLSKHSPFNLNHLLGKSLSHLFCVVKIDCFCSNALLMMLGVSESSIPNYRNVSILDSRFDSDRYVDNIDVAYYLTNGQPFQAYL